MKKKAIIVSGYFNPIHKGHIEYFNLAKQLADYLFVIVNNDFQRELKGSKLFMLENERKIIVEQIKTVDKAFLSVDKDKSVSETLKKITSIYSKDYELIFANGGDRNNKTTPEIEFCNKNNVRTIWGIGGSNKTNSSSLILKKWIEN